MWVDFGPCGNFVETGRLCTPTRVPVRRWQEALDGSGKKVKRWEMFTAFPLLPR